MNTRKQNIQTMLSITVLVLAFLCVPFVASAGVAEGIKSIIHEILTGIGSVALWLGGVLLDASLFYMVANMGQTLEDFQMITAIDQLWRVMRDIFNLTFIFALVFTGVQIILGSNEGQAKKTIGTIIIAALLINFSLFITKSIVDFSNLAAFEIYKMINVFDAGVPIMGGTVEVKGIASEFIRVSDLNGYQEIAGNSIGEAVSGLGASIAISFLLMVCMVVIAFIFAAGAFLMISRFIGLIVIMIFSPIMFLGFVLPKFKSSSSKWWRYLLSYSFMGPAYIFMLYLSLFVLQTLTRAGGVGELNKAGQGEGITSFAGFFIYIIIVIGFAYMSLEVAKKMGVAGSTATLNLAKNTANRVGRAGGVLTGKTAFGVPGAALRNTVGRYSQKAADSEWLKERAAKGGLASSALKLSRKAGNASFDARGVGGLGKKMGVGNAAKGYKTKRDDYVKKQKDFAKSLGEVDDKDAKVQGYQKKVKLIEEEILKANDLGDKPRARELKKEKEAAILDVKREKARRQTGSAEYYKRYEDELKKSEKEIATLEADYSEAIQNGGGAGEDSRADIIALENKIREERKNAAGLRKNKKRNFQRGGYAGTLEKRGVLRAIISGKPGFDTAAGKEIRKEVEKKHKTTKEDKNANIIKEAIEKNKPN